VGEGADGRVHRAFVDIAMSHKADRRLPAECEDAAIAQTCFALADRGGTVIRATILNGDERMCSVVAREIRS